MNKEDVETLKKEVEEHIKSKKLSQMIVAMVSAMVVTLLLAWLR